MRHLLAKLELEGISIFSFKAVTRCFTEKIGLFPRGYDPLNSAPVTQKYKQVNSVFACAQYTWALTWTVNENPQMVTQFGRYIHWNLLALTA